MPGLLGKKIGMTSVFSADGKNIPCTVIEVGPCVVTQVKTIEKDGYEAVQIGFVEKKDKHTTAAMAGHFKKAGVAPQRYLAEFKNFDQEYKLGDVIGVDLFEGAEFVDIAGTSKGNILLCDQKHSDCKSQEKDAERRVEDRNRCVNRNDGL